MMAGKARQPWMKWYGADWRADPAIRMSSLAARGLWIDLIGYMQEGEPYGFLTIAGRVPSVAQIAQLVGATERDTARLLEELRVNGVYSAIGDDVDDGLTESMPDWLPGGTIFSRRMVRDKAKADADAANGKIGGNPALNRKANRGVGKGVNPPLGHPHKAQSPESRVQNLDPTPPSTPLPRATEPEPWIGWARKVKAVVNERWPDDERVLRLDGGLCRQWHADGYDLERDVLPVVTRLCGEYRKPDVISSLKYFSSAIAKRHAERIADQASGKGGEVSDADALAKLRSTIEAAYRRDGQWCAAWPWRPEMGPRPDDPRYDWGKTA